MTPRRNHLIDKATPANAVRSGDVVLDPFCGCGTTIDAAEKLGRDWIGIDVTQLAISFIKNHLQDTYGTRLKFVSGGARASRPPYSASSPNAPSAPEESSTRNNACAPVIGATPMTATGTVALPEVSLVRIIGEPKAAKPERIIIQVKGGKTGVKDVRDLRGVLDREKAAIGILISLQPPHRPDGNRSRERWLLRTQDEPAEIPAPPTLHGERIDGRQRH